MQNGAETPVKMFNKGKETGKKSTVPGGLEDVFMMKTPALITTMRAANVGKMRNHDKVHVMLGDAFEDY